MSRRTNNQSPILDCLTFPSALINGENGDDDDAPAFSTDPVAMMPNGCVKQPIVRTMHDYVPLKREIDSLQAKCDAEQQQLSSLKFKQSSLVRRSSSVISAVTTVARQDNPFSGGSPLKKRSTPFLPMCHRDFETSLEVQVSCMNGVKEGFVFSSDREGVQLFLYCLKSKAEMLGVDEATYVVKDGDEFCLAEFGAWTRISVDDVRAYEEEVNVKERAGDLNAARLIKEFLYLKILVTSSLPARIGLALATSCRPTDSGPAMLRVLLQITQGSNKFL